MDIFQIKVEFSWQTFYFLSFYLVMKLLFCFLALGILVFSVKAGDCFLPGQSSEPVRLFSMLICYFLTVNFFCFLEYWNAIMLLV